MQESFIHVFNFPLVESLKSDTIENCKNIGGGEENKYDDLIKQLLVLITV